MEAQEPLSGMNEPYFCFLVQVGMLQRHPEDLRDWLPGMNENWLVQLGREGGWGVRGSLQAWLLGMGKSFLS